MTAQSDLKPCPFCGGKAKTHGPYGWYRQWCISHSCKTFYTGAQDAFKDYPNEAEAIAAWNTRTQPAPDPLLDQLAEALRTAITQNEHDMLMTGEELRECSKALSAFDARRA